jgi:nucleoside 2-deoxyribosyltransferase
MPHDPFRRAGDPRAGDPRAGNPRAGHAGGRRVYLAGPDVFLPDPVARGAALKEVCARHGLSGVFPLDPLEVEPPGWAALAAWERIALRNEAHIRSCDALIANLTPFRGPSADAGTVFELGFMRALQRPVFGWSNTSVRFEPRTRAALNRPHGRDADGLAIESFGCVDNLMIDGAIRASGGTLVVADHEGPARWAALEAFEACALACARVLEPTA